MSGSEAIPESNFPRRLGRLFADATAGDAADAAPQAPEAKPEASPNSGAAPVAGGRTIQWKGKTLNVGGASGATPGGGPPGAATTPMSQPSVAAAGATEAAPKSTPDLTTLAGGLENISGGMEEMYALLVKMSERETTSERIFNTLHAELSDYKKDFIYEHLKPVVRPLLFLYDSLEQFEGEVTEYAKSAAPAQGDFPPSLVGQNTRHFREQLIEALRICEVTPMETPSGEFNARWHKAVGVEVGGPENHIVRTIRSGWFLNGQLLRAAEVIVGRKR